MSEDQYPGNTPSVEIDGVRWWTLGDLAPMMGYDARQLRQLIDRNPDDFSERVEILRLTGPEAAACAAQLSRTSGGQVSSTSRATRLTLLSQTGIETAAALAQTEPAREFRRRLMRDRHALAPRTTFPVRDLSLESHRLLHRLDEIAKRIDDAMGSTFNLESTRQDAMWHQVHALTDLADELIRRKAQTPHLMAVFDQLARVRIDVPSVSTLVPRVMAAESNYEAENMEHLNNGGLPHLLAAAAVVVAERAVHGFVSAKQASEALASIGISEDKFVGVFCDLEDLGLLTDGWSTAAISAVREPKT